MNQEAEIIENEELESLDNDEIEVDEIELQAREQGWLPKEEFKGDPELWRPAKHYVEMGEMMKTIKDQKQQIRGMKKNHNEQIERLNLFNKAQLEQRIKDIQKEMKIAVEDGDTQRVNELSDERAQAETAKNSLSNSSESTDAELKEEWEMNNYWIFDPNDPRVGVANNAFNAATRKGMTMEDALEFVDGIIQEKFPEGGKRGNKNRLNDAEFASGKGGAKPRAPQAKLTMDMLTPKELNLREAFPPNITDEQFLEAVANSRKGV